MESEGPLFTEAKALLFQIQVRQLALGHLGDLVLRIVLDLVEKAMQDGRALYCGEYGVIDRAAEEDRQRWLRDIGAAFDKLGIGRAQWNYKEKDFGI